MKPMKGTVILTGIVILAILAGGCTSGKSPAATTPAATLAVQPTTTNPPAAAAATTPACPDEKEKGVWDGTWDTRWMSYAGNHDITTISFGDDGSPDSWNGINAPGPTEVMMTQKCRDVTGTVSFSMDPPCSGTINGSINGNQLSGSWKTGGCQPEEQSFDGKFTLTMAADNRTWTGTIIGTKWLGTCPGCPPNWAGKKVV